MLCNICYITNWRLYNQRGFPYVARCLLHNNKLCYIAAIIIAHPNLPYGYVARYESVGLPASQLCAYSCSAGFIYHQTSAWHGHELAKGISFRIPAPPPRPSSGSDSRRRRQLTITAAACCRRLRRPLPKSCSPRATHRRHPSERWSAPGNARLEETCRIPAWPRAPCIRWISRWQYLGKSIAEVFYDVLGQGL